MAKSILLVFLNLMVLYLQANCHYKEYLIYQNDTLLVDYIPLSDSLKKVIQAKAINKNEGTSLICLSGEGRKVWLLRNDSLFLKELLNCCGNRLLDKDSVNLFSQSNPQDELFCGWLSHNIYHQFGQQMEASYHHECFYEFDKDFLIENGILKGMISYDNRKSKTSNFRSDPIQLSRLWLKNINWEKVEKCNEDGNKTLLLSIEVDENGRPINIEVLRGQNEVCNNLIIQALKKINGWDRYYKRGVLQKIKWNLPIKLNKKFYEEKIKEADEKSG